MKDLCLSRPSIYLSELSEFSIILCQANNKSFVIAGLVIIITDCRERVNDVAHLNWHEEKRHAFRWCHKQLNFMARMAAWVKREVLPCVFIIGKSLVRIRSAVEPHIPFGVIVWHLRCYHDMWLWCRLRPTIGCSPSHAHSIPLVIGCVNSCHPIMRVNREFLLRECHDVKSFWLRWRTCWNMPHNNVLVSCTACVTGQLCE